MSVDTLSEPAKSDHVLAAEIAPAMQKHLRFWGAVQGAYFWIVFVFVILNFAHRYDASILGVVGLLAWGFVGLPGCIWLGQRTAIAMQVKYRRLHGKWRWDH